MRLRHAMLVPLFLGGCGGGGGGGGSEGDAEAVAGEDSVAVDSAAQAPVVIRAAMPDFPEVEAGQLAALTSTRQEEYLFSGSWDATAGRCREPSLIQVLAQGEGLGVILLFGPSRNADEVGEYEVVSGIRGAPDSSTARVAVQLFPAATRTHVFRGATGTAEIQRIDSVVAGRLAVTMIESSFRDSVFLAGSFNVPLGNAPDEWCQVVGVRGRNTPPTPVRSRGAPG